METATLAPVLGKPGPYATVLVDVSQDNESGRQQHDARVRAACDELAAQGAPAEVIERIASVLAEQTSLPAPASRLVIGTPDEIVYDRVAVLRQDQPICSWHPLPDLTAWAAHRDAGVRFLLVLVDHAGGEVTLWDSDVPEPRADVTAGGETEDIHQVPVGGWASIQVQRTTQNVWRRNAEDVVEEVRRLVAEHRPDVVLLSGDPASIGIARPDLERLDAALVELSSGQRNADGGDEALQQAIREALHQVVVERRTAQLHRVREAMGRGSGVATGVRDVADALVQGQVETLLFDPARAPEMELDPRDHPGLTFGAATVEGPVRADEALIAAAVLTEADIVAMPSAALGGAPVVALLRWTA
jgi:hypothetical protein